MRRIQAVHRIPYKMAHRAWLVIVKEGIARGCKPLATPFFVDKESLMGMMWYHGVPWVFPVEKDDEAEQDAGAL